MHVNGLRHGKGTNNIRTVSFLKPIVARRVYKSRWLAILRRLAEWSSNRQEFMIRKRRTATDSTVVKCRWLEIFRSRHLYFRSEHTMERRCLRGRFCKVNDISDKCTCFWFACGLIIVIGNSGLWEGKGVYRFANGDSCTLDLFFKRWLLNTLGHEWKMKEIIEMENNVVMENSTMQMVSRAKRRRWGFDIPLFRIVVCWSV